MLEYGHLSMRIKRITTIPPPDQVSKPKGPRSEEDLVGGEGSNSVGYTQVYCRISSPVALGQPWSPHNTLLPEQDPIGTIVPRPPQ
jgi:hypothetical protein